ncbi:hypothetical protein [Janthinobacterium lividum]|uniref:hypothetical protein n=1 Tax=Janthinobacterium lividum TaxID=29581 RepID=UPI000FE271EA|nr:hypothetical protein [Janthinobacterium lividum]
MAAINDGAGAAAALEWGGMAAQVWRYYNYFTVGAVLQDANSAFVWPGEKGMPYGKSSGQIARQGRYCG